MNSNSIDRRSAIKLDGSAFAIASGVSVVKRLILPMMVAFAACTVSAKENVVARFSALDLSGGRIVCKNPGSWKFETAIVEERGGCATLEVKLSSPQDADPPCFDVCWNVPQGDIRHFWSPQSHTVELLMPWCGTRTSDIAHTQPLYALTGNDDEAEFAVSSSECLRKVVFQPVCDDHGQKKMYYKCWMRFFSAPEAPMREYAMRMRFDRRKQKYWNTLREMSDWQMEAAGLVALPAGDQCFKPLYSSWYTYHGDPTQADVEGDCKVAAALGMSNLIVDDGWNCEPGTYGYRFCGDWEVSKRKFPDMKAHVDFIHSLGMKYMMWFALPFVGKDAKVYPQWKDKLLPFSCAGGEVMDPRFPEVRQFIAALYERKLKEFGIDGFKLDFIDCFNVPERDKDPAVRENYAGRDIRSVPEAVKVLMADVVRRLRAIRPDIMIEFRQAYTGPAIRSFGNMLRATDCPMDPDANRERIARLRLVSGKTAVHADMLAWRFDAAPEAAAENVLHSIFGVIQYSIELKKAPEGQLRMIRHWVDFSLKHEEALLRGEFRAHMHYARYPLIEGEGAREKVIGVYDRNVVAPVGDIAKPTYVLNGTGRTSLVIETMAPGEVEVFDTFGEKVAKCNASAGIVRIEVPRSGYLRVSK